MSEKAPTKPSRKEASARKLAEDSDDSAPEVKKGRGRPKKDLSDKKSPKPMAEPGEKKTRGRPKGSTKSEISKVAPSSKRRGRPRKDKKKSEDEDQISEDED